MDYKGQELAEHLYYYIIILFGSVAWILGYIWQDFQTVVIGCAAGVLVSTLLVVPDWPFFNRNPVKWLDALPDRRSGGGGASADAAAQATKTTSSGEGESKGGKGKSKKQS